MLRAPRLIAPASVLFCAAGRRSLWPACLGSSRRFSERPPPAACVSLPTSGGYTAIYTFPAIRVLRALSRLKLAQTGITLLLLPGVCHLYLQGQASVALLAYSAGIAIFATVALFGVSHCARRVVGAMYLDSTCTTLRVAHLSFWGHRRDAYVPVSDVMTLGDTGDPAGEVILRLRRYSRPGTLYFSTRLGRVLDRRGFESVFGSL